VRVALRNLDTGFDKSAWPEWAKRALKRDHERDYQFSLGSVIVSP
jgi:hypothetical protein